MAKPTKPFTPEELEKLGFAGSRPARPKPKAPPARRLPPMVRVLLRSYDAPGLAAQGRVRGLKAGPPGGWADPVPGTQSESRKDEQAVKLALGEQGVVLQKKWSKGAVAWLYPTSHGVWVVGLDVVRVRRAFESLGLSPRKAQKPGTPTVWT